MLAAFAVVDVVEEEVDVVDGDVGIGGKDNKNVLVVADQLLGIGGRPGDEGVGGEGVFVSSEGVEVGYEVD